MAFTNNKIKQATATVPAGCIGKGTMQLGVDQRVTFGPTSSTGFWNGIKPPGGGWTVYLTKATQGPSIYTTTDIVASTKQISGTNITSEQQALDWYFNQADKIVTNKTFPSLLTDGLRFAWDADFPPCFDRGAGYYDMGPQHYDTDCNGAYDGGVKSSVYLANDGANPSTNTKGFTINTTFDFQTISIWINTKPQQSSTYTLFGSFTSGLNADTTGIGSDYVGSTIFIDGQNDGTFNNLNQVIKQDQQFHNIIITLPSSVSAGKLSIFSKLGVNGTEGYIGEVYCWAGVFTDQQANEHFNEFCGRYNIC